MIKWNMEAGASRNCLPERNAQRDCNAGGGETRRGDWRLFSRCSHSIQRPSEQYHDRFSSRAKEGKPQITGVFDLSAKLAKLICHRVDNIFAAIREHDLHVAANHLWAADVQQLSSDDKPIALWLQLELEIDLIGLSAVEQLSDAPGSRAYSCQDRLRKAVVQQLNRAGCFLSPSHRAGQCECGLDEANFFRGRLVTSLDHRRIGDFPPKRSRLRVILATRSQVLLHHLLPTAGSRVVHQITPCHSAKVLHLRSPMNFSSGIVSASVSLSTLQPVTRFQRYTLKKEERRRRKYR